MSEREAALGLREQLDAKFGKNIVVLDLHGVTPIADFFVIATGQNAPHLKSLQDAAEEFLGKAGFKMGHIEGHKSSNWVLLDFGSILVHLFDKESREYYNLEHIWADAKTIQCDRSEKA